MNKRISDYLSHIGGSVPDIFADVYFTFFKEKEDATDAFASFLTLWGDRESDNSVIAKNYYKDEEYLERYNAIADIIETVHTNLIEENNPPQVFYSKLWNNISNTALCATDLDTICAMIHIMASPLTPYFEMEEALSMREDEYMSVSKEIEPYVKKAIFALNRNYKQRTQVASQIISIFNKIEDPREQTVYVAHLIGYSQFKLRKLKSELDAMHEEIIEDEEE